MAKIICSWNTLYRNSEWSWGSQHWRTAAFESNKIIQKLVKQYRQTNTNEIILSSGYGNCNRYILITKLLTRNTSFILRKALTCTSNHINLSLIFVFLEPVSTFKTFRCKYNRSKSGFIPTPTSPASSEKRFASVNGNSCWTWQWISRWK